MHVDPTLDLHRSLRYVSRRAYASVKAPHDAPRVDPLAYRMADIFRTLSRVPYASLELLWQWGKLFYTLARARRRRPEAKARAIERVTRKQEHEIN